MPTVRVGDLTMYYEIHGAGEPLVLIPGLSIDVTAFERLIALLAQHCQVIIFDNRGAGRTDKPDTPYSIGMMADDTFGLLAALGVQRATVLGVSMGGRIATELALRHPELVTRLILVSTFVRRLPPGAGSPMLKLAVKVPFIRRIGKRYPQPQYAFKRQFAASRDYDATGRLSEIHVPTLVLHGRGDQSAPFDAAEEIQRGIAGSRLIAFDGGHIFFLMRPQPFVDAVVAFLKTPAAPA